MITTGGSPPVTPAPHARGRMTLLALTGRPRPSGLPMALWPSGPMGSLRPAARAAPRPRRDGAARRAGAAATRPDWVPWLIALAVFAAYTTISLSRYLQLDPGSWDLGIFTEYVRQLAHLRAPVVDIRGAGFNLLGDHFQPIVGLIAPVFLIFPSAATLLVVQALLTAVSVIPVSRAAAARLGTGAGRMIGAAYGFSWGLQQMIDFDFHEIAFAVPLLACSLSALVRGKVRGRGAVGAAAGVRQGGPGLHGRGDRHRDDRHGPEPGRGTGGRARWPGQARGSRAGGWPGPGWPVPVARSAGGRC